MLSSNFSNKVLFFRIVLDLLVSVNIHVIKTITSNLADAWCIFPLISWHFIMCRDWTDIAHFPWRRKDSLSSKIRLKHQELQRRSSASWRYRWLAWVSSQVVRRRPQVPDLANSSLPSPPPGLVSWSPWRNSSTAKAEEFYYSFYCNEGLENKLTRAPLLCSAKSIYYVWTKIIIQITIDFFLIEQLRIASKMPILPCKGHVRFWVLS